MKRMNSRTRDRINHLVGFYNYKGVDPNRFSCPNSKYCEDSCGQRLPSRTMAYVGPDYDFSSNCRVLFIGIDAGRSGKGKILDVDGRRRQIYDCYIGQQNFIRGLGRWHNRHLYGTLKMLRRVVAQ
jgi:hypothetical protein